MLGRCFVHDLSPDKLASQPYLFQQQSMKVGVAYILLLAGETSMVPAPMARVGRVIASVGFH